MTGGGNLIWVGGLRESVDLENSNCRRSRLDPFCRLLLSQRAPRPPLTLQRAAQAQNARRLPLGWGVLASDG